MTNTTEIEQFTDHFTNPPQRRKGALWLLRDVTGDVLIVKKQRLVAEGSLRPWGLVGGSAEGNERAATAAERHLRRETGLSLTAGRLLVIDEVEANAVSTEGDNWVFDGGIIQPHASIVLSDDLLEYRFVSRAELSDFLTDRQRDRVANAWDAYRTGGTRHLVNGKTLAA